MLLGRYGQTRIGATESGICGAGHCEYVAKLGIVNEQSDEAVYWLEVMRDAKIGNCREVALILPEARELRAIFATSYRTAKQGRDRGKR
jgi:hypothetical protein